MMSHPSLRWLLVLTAVALAGGAYAAGPVLFWGSDPIRPNEVLVLSGGGWGDGATVQVGRLADGNPGVPPGPASVPFPAATVLKPLQSSAHCLKALVPAGWKPGIFACRVLSGGQASAPLLLNAPTPWWVQGDAGHQGSPGGWLRIFGKCLSLGEPATVCLVSAAGRRVSLRTTADEGWALIAALPADVVSGEYEVWVHNGHGGPAGWRSAGPVTIAPHRPPWPAQRFSVTDFGAVADNNQDCTAAVQATIDKAGENGGIVFFPRGKYTLTATLQIPTHVLLQGAGEDLVELHWRDRPDPLPALIQGTNSFGVEDLMMTAMNHLHGIVADQGEREGAGNVVISHVRMRLVRTLYQKDPQEVERRFREPLGDAIRAGGDNLVITDCDIYISGRSLYLSRTRCGLVANNTFTNGPWGWYCISGSDGLIFENNRIVGGDNMSTGGGLNCLDGSPYSQNVYFAHNKLGPFFGWDREAMTTDAGGGAYHGKLAAVQGNTVTLAGDLSNPGSNWVGAGLYLLSGTGTGQYRRVVKVQGRTVTLDSPFTVPPDDSTYASLTFYQGRYLLIGNEADDASMTVQIYGISLEDIVAHNRAVRAGGFHNYGLNYNGFQPSWYTQYFDNEIVEGLGFNSNDSQYPPPPSHLTVFGQTCPGWPGPLARFTIMRRNRLDNNARIQVLNKCADVLIENNLVCQSDVGIELDKVATGVLLRGNKFEDVGQQVTGSGAE